uniref:Uncharacterized protein n=1 Tax=Spironucleus salmonicida TaxID=348837 RepID=V6LJ93_9EUKA|eukprot:EST44647.1 Hypothetical protein SS50377_15656 [Spironucleus salmonicida]
MSQYLIEYQIRQNAIFRESHEPVVYSAVRLVPGNERRREVQGKAILAKSSKFGRVLAQCDDSQNATATQKCYKNMPHLWLQWPLRKGGNTACYKCGK